MSLIFVPLVKSSCCMSILRNVHVALSNMRVKIGLPQRLKNLEIGENDNGHEIVLEYEKLAKRHGILPIFPLKFTKMCSFCANINRFSISFKKSTFSNHFRKTSQMQNFREMVMENQETIMVIVFLQSLWEPCQEPLC